MLMGSLMHSIFLDSRVFEVFCLPVFQELIYFTGPGVNYNNRTYLNNSLTPEWLRCRPSQKPHILPCMLRFFAALRLALGRDPYF